MNRTITIKHKGGIATANKVNGVWLASAWSDICDHENGSRAEALQSSTDPFTENDLRDLIDTLQSGELD